MEIRWQFPNSENSCKISNLSVDPNLVENNMIFRKYANQQAIRFETLFVSSMSLEKMVNDLLPTFHGD